MRHYQNVTSNLPYWVYRRALDLVKDYDRIVETLDDLITMTHEQDGQPRGSDLSDPTVRAVMAREHYLADARAVEKALALVDEDIREMVFLSWKDDTPLYSFDDYFWNARRVTKARQDFLENVARFAGLWWE